MFVLLTGASMPLAHALAEDYLLEDGARQDALHLPRRDRSAPAGRGGRSAVARLPTRCSRVRASACRRVLRLTIMATVPTANYPDEAYVRPSNRKRGAPGDETRLDRRRRSARALALAGITVALLLAPGSRSSSSSSEASLVELSRAPPADVVELERRSYVVVGVVAFVFIVSSLACIGRTTTIERRNDRCEPPAPLWRVRGGNPARRSAGRIGGRARHRAQFLRTVIHRVPRN